MKKLLKTSFLFLLPLQLLAATLVNINTADLATLETLNGIGPSKGQAIIDYRTQHGPFAKIEDIMNVSGIGTATYNNIKNSITVGETITQTTGTTSTTQTSTSTQTTQTQTSATSTSSDTQAAAGVAPVITVRATVPTRVMVGGGAYFEATALGSEGLPLPYPRCIWNFGDGTTAEGCRVLHAYSYPGSYSVVINAAYNYSSAISRITVEAVAAQVSLRVEADGSLTLVNNSNQQLDIGYWSFLQGDHPFIIPEATDVLAGGGVRFAPAVLGFVATTDARLLYPNQAVAASAVPGDSSPLRGERVVVASAKTSAPKTIVQASQPTRETTGQVLGTSTKSDSSPMLWWSLGGLVFVLATGGAAAYYARRPKVVAETYPTAEEFDIE